MMTETTTPTNDTDKRIEALAKHLGIEPSEVTQGRYDNDSFKAHGSEFLVLTDSEADERASEYILETLWAFNVEFIAAHSKTELDDDAIKALKEVQGKLCESANSVFLALINDTEDFVADAIRSDGRGHFLSQYDSNEWQNGEYFIYQTN